MDRTDLGILGLGVMGENLVTNLASRGFRVTVYNRTPERTRQFVSRTNRDQEINATFSPQDFVDSLESPKKILVMVQAGNATDAVLKQVSRFLSKGDVIMDGGNSFFRDTIRRSRWIKRQGVDYIGLGISGGEEGARKGPCIMAGGPQHAYEQVEPILDRIVARVDGEPCLALLGPSAAGHFVKMVHNGIEYALLQLIAETYDIQAVGLGLHEREIQRFFMSSNEGELGSYLMEITLAVLAERNPGTNDPLLGVILDKAAQKGTGAWASQTSMDLGVPVPSIDSAVAARNISAYKGERVRASTRLASGPSQNGAVNSEKMLIRLHDALTCSWLVSYGQGFALIKRASDEYGYNTDLSEVARIWRGGCIIRCKLLDKIRLALGSDADLPNLLLDNALAEMLQQGQGNWRLAVSDAKHLGVPIPSMSASLDYYDGYRRHTLPANLIQALRDYFGAHTYERVDREGQFHTKWPTS